MKTAEMLVGNSRTATKRAIRVWFYFVTIFILHTILRDKCTGKNTLARTPYLRPKLVTYCKTTGISFSLIWEPPPSPRQVGKNSSIRYTIYNSVIITLNSENASLCNILFLAETWRVKQVFCIYL